VGDEVDSFSFLFVLFQCCFIVYQCDDDLTIPSDIGLSDKDKISFIDSFLIHRVSLSAEKIVLIDLIHDLCRYRDLGLDIFLCKDWHTTGDSSDERNSPYCIAITAEVRRYLEIIPRVSIEPTFSHDLIEEDRDRPGRGISES
jgi:hypothetical protein